MHPQQLAKQTLRTGVWVLLHVEVVQAHAKLAQNHVAEALQLICRHTVRPSHKHHSRANADTAWCPSPPHTQTEHQTCTAHAHVPSLPPSISVLSFSLRCATSASRRALPDSATLFRGSTASAEVKSAHTHIQRCHTCSTTHTLAGVESHKSFYNTQKHTQKS